MGKIVKNKRIVEPDFPSPELPEEIAAIGYLAALEMTLEESLIFTNPVKLKTEQSIREELVLMEAIERLEGKWNRDLQTKYEEWCGHYRMRGGFYEINRLGRNA